MERIPFLMLAALGLAPNMPIASAADVRVDSYVLEKQTLKTPRVAADARGEKRSFSEVYVVKLKGNIPTYGAMPVLLFIGDEPIREYGATPDGVYFKVYDRSQLQRWAGKPIRYALRPGEMHDTGVIFRGDAVSN